MLSSPPIPPRIRVATFNVHFARRPERFAENMLARTELSRADVIVLQEIEEHYKEFVPRAQVIAEQAGMTHIYAPSRILPGRGTHGIAVLSRYPITDHGVIPLPFKKLLLRSRPRIAMACTITVGQTPVRLFNVHLDTRLNTADRIDQIRPVIEGARQWNRVVIAGDLNTAPIRWLKNSVPVGFSNQARAVRDFMAKEGYTTKFEKEHYTMRQGYLRMQLDWIFARGLNIERAGVDHGLLISDHRPLWMDLSL